MNNSKIIKNNSSSDPIQQWRNPMKINKWNLLLRNDSFVLNSVPINTILINKFTFFTIKLVVPINYRFVIFIIDVIYDDLNVHIFFFLKFWCIVSWRRLIVHCALALLIRSLYSSFSRWTVVFGLLLILGPFLWL